MNIVSQVLASIGSFIIQVISLTGYGGVFFLMTLESMIFPIPSELVMPFAGFLVAKGEMNFWLVILFSSLGSVCGSLLSYYLGRVGGNKVVLHWGKYLFLEEEDLLKTEQWFSRKGEITIFIGRLIPAVRHIISIPAGIGKMNLKKFVVYTLIGATLWNSFLAYLGYVLGQNWEMVRQYSDYISIPIVIILGLAGIYVIYKHVKRKLGKQNESNLNL